MQKTYMDIMQEISRFLAEFEKKLTLFNSKRSSYEVKYSDFSYTMYVNVPCFSSEFVNEENVMNLVNEFMSSFNKQKFKDNVLPHIQSYKSNGVIAVVIRLEVLTAERLYNYSLN